MLSISSATPANRTSDITSYEPSSAAVMPLVMLGSTPAMLVSWLLCSSFARSALATLANDSVAFFQAHVPTTPPSLDGEALASRSYFYVGGQYVDVSDECAASATALS